MSPRKKTRKSPYHHTVRKHIRDGKPVHQYERGEGDAPTRNPRRKKLAITSDGSGGEYDIVITYDGEQEYTSQLAESYRNALDSTLNKVPRRPIKITLRGSHG